MSSISTPFDDVYKTLLEKFPQLVIPVLNEEFGTDFEENEPVINLRQEYHKEEGYVAADSVIKVRDKIYHVECQSNPDGTIGVRMLEYDFYIGIRESKPNDRGIYQVKLPRSCVIYLRHNDNTEDEIPVEVILHENAKFQYRVPVIKVQNYSLEEIFEKKLFLYLPFYAIRYENLRDKRKQSPEKLQLILDEYNVLIQRLNQTYINNDDGQWIASEISKSINQIAEHLFQGEENEEIREGIGGIVMGGTVMKTIKEEFEELTQQIQEQSEQIQEKDEQIQEKDEQIQEKDEQIQKNREQHRKCIDALRKQGLTDLQIQTEYGIAIEL